LKKFGKEEDGREGKDRGVGVGGGWNVGVL